MSDEKRLTHGEMSDLQVMLNKLATQCWGVQQTNLSSSLLIPFIDQMNALVAYWQEHGQPRSAWNSVKDRADLVMRTHTANSASSVYYFNLGNVWDTVKTESETAPEKPECCVADERLFIQNAEGNCDRVREHQVTEVHVGWWDDHRGAWVPVHGRRDELQFALGSDWVYDEYYGSFFSSLKAQED